MSRSFLRHQTKSHFPENRSGNHVFHIIYTPYICLGGHPWWSYFQLCIGENITAAIRAVQSEHIVARHATGTKNHGQFCTILNIFTSWNSSKRFVRIIKSSHEIRGTARGHVGCDSIVCKWDRFLYPNGKPSLQHVTLTYLARLFYTLLISCKCGF